MYRVALRDELEGIVTWSCAGGTTIHSPFYLINISCACAELHHGLGGGGGSGVGRDVVMGMGAFWIARKQAGSSKLGVLASYLA